MEGKKTRSMKDGEPEWEKWVGSVMTWLKEYGKA